MIDASNGWIAAIAGRSFYSRDDKKSWARAIAMMRRGFGGHPYGADEGIAEARRTERVGDFVRPDETGQP